VRSEGKCRGADEGKEARKGRPGAARALAENPDATRDIYAERCACGAALAKAGQELARAWDHVDLPPIKPIATRINLFRAKCPCCKARVTAQAPADMPEGSPFGPGINAAVAYLHGCQMVGFRRLTELCEGLFGLTISQGAISNMLARMGKRFGAAAEQIAATVRSSEVIASDETTARVKGKTHWQWTFGCATADRADARQVRADRLSRRRAAKGVAVGSPAGAVHTCRRAPVLPRPSDP